MSGVPFSAGMTSSRTNAATRLRSSTSSGERSKSMSALEILENRRGSLPAAHAHRDHAVARLAAPHFAEKLNGELGAGSAQRMPEGGRAAVHVDALLVHTELAHHCERLRAERFVELDEIDLIEFQSRELQRFRDRGDRPHAHDLGRDSADSERYESRERLQA